jgi:hypothetical protein
MALGATKISALAGPSLSAAAASARPLSGGRGVAAAAQSEVEETSFSGQIGVNDNSILHTDDGTGFDPDGQRRDSPQQGTPFVSRSAFGFSVTDASGDSGATPATSFRDAVAHGVGVYEYNLKVITPSAVKPGSVVNHLF